MTHMKNNDFDFIKNKFDNDGISAPDSLDEGRAMELISEKKPSKIKLYKRNTFKSLVSLAACAAVVISCISAAKSSNTAELESYKSGSTLGSISYFDSYSDLRKAVKKSAYATDIYFAYVAETVKGSATAVSDTVSVQGANGGSSFGETYTQAEGVDEADIVKNDGKYIYVASPSDSVIRIYEGNGTEPRLAASIDDFNTEDDGVYEPVNEMYLKDGMLIVNTTSTETKQKGRAFNTAHSYVYDISDLNQIRRISHFKQSGYYTDSRMIEDTLYILSTKETYSEFCKNMDDYVPYAYAVDEKKEYLTADKICCPAGTSSASMLVVSAIDIKTGKKVSDTKAVFGCDGTVYCNENNLYIAVSRYEDNESKVNIIKASLGEEISFTDAATVDGCINNQFSMDEYNGYFRIATTTESFNEKKGTYDRSNNLFVLDSALKTVGEVTGFAKNESIEAVKFVGDTAYVITYENTDPLFVIDLKNPQKPEILGSVKIDGFSSQLLPIGEDRILGIGYHTEEDPWETGIKLVLFDVSDKSVPKVLDSYVMLDASSQAQNEHKAILINNIQGYYAIDFDTSDCGYENIKMGALTFEVNNDRIYVTNIFDYYDEIKDTDDIYSYTPVRTTYIGDTVYSVDFCGNLYAFDYNG